MQFFSDTCRPASVPTGGAENDSFETSVWGQSGPTAAHRLPQIGLGGMAGVCDWGAGRRGGVAGPGETHPDTCRPVTGALPARGAALSPCGGGRDSCSAPPQSVGAGRFPRLPWPACTWPVLHTRRTPAPAPAPAAADPVTWGDTPDSNGCPDT